MVRLVLNLAPFSGLTFAEFNKNTKDKDIRDKIAFLEPYLRKAIFTNDFVSAVPNFKKYNHPLESPALYDLLINIFENLKEIQEKSEVLMDSLIYQFKKYSSVEIQFNTSGGKNVYIMFERAIDVIAKSVDDPVKKWSTYLTLKNFLEDYEGNRVYLANHATNELKKAKILVKSVENLIAVFDKIPESEYLKILGSTTIFTSLPTPKQTTDLVHVCELLQEANLTNLNQLDSAIKLFEFVLKMANPFLPQHKKKKPENTNTSEEQLVENKAPAILHKQEVISAVLTPELPASSKSMVVPEEIASATPVKHEVNPQTFFANGSQSPTKSLTSIIKQEAKEKIAKQKIKTTKPATGKHIEHQNSTAESASDQSAEKTVYFHSENNPDEPIAAKAFLLPGMKHIYFCCDAKHMQAENLALIKEFQQIARQGIILARNSLGQEGIKMYGLNFAYLKSLSKNFAAHRMLCIAHQIEGTNLHVYRGSCGRTPKSVRFARGGLTEYVRKISYFRRIYHMAFISF